MKTYRIKISGKELIMDACNERTMATSGKNKPELIPTECYLHRDDRGIVFMPNIMVAFCLKEGAGRIVERGRTTYKKTLLGRISIEPAQIHLEPQTWREFGRYVKRGDGLRVFKCNPLFENWSIEFTLKTDDGLPSDTMREILETAGQVYGIGGFRVAGYGRFKIDKFLNV